MATFLMMSIIMNEGSAVNAECADRDVEKGEWLDFVINGIPMKMQVTRKSQRG